MREKLKDKMIERLGNYKLQIGKLQIIALQSAICNLQFAIFILCMLFVSCNTGSEKHVDHRAQYTCPMHPQVVQEEPGTCPVCGMDLVPVSSNGDSTAISEDLSYMLEPVNHTIIADLQTVTPVKRQMKVGAEANGMIMYDTRRAYTIPIRFGGRIEKLYINYNFEPVHKGQKIMEIYSPEMVTAQKELLYLLESDPGNKRLIGAAIQKLRLLGLTNAQINRLAEAGMASYSLPVYSPYSGYIYEEAATPAFQPAQPQTQNAGGMDVIGESAATAPGMSSQTRLGIRQGMYLNKGEIAFKVINTDRLWAEFNIYPEAVPYVKKGDSVIIMPDFNRDMKIEAKVDFIQPYYQNGERFSKVRVYLDNTQNSFKAGQLVTAQFTSQSDSTWWIPATAVLDLGTKKVVFVKENDVFHPQVITTGRPASDWIEVTSGLSATDSIAPNGHFLVDSEGFVEVGN